MLDMSQKLPVFMPKEPDLVHCVLHLLARPPARCTCTSHGHDAAVPSDSWSEGNSMFIWVFAAPNETSQVQQRYRAQRIFLTEAQSDNSMTSYMVSKKMMEVNPTHSILTPGPLLCEYPPVT